jgi:hypothetical protein
MLKFIKKQREIRLRKWCAKFGNSDTELSDEILKWITSTSRKHDIRLKQWCIEQAAIRYAPQQTLYYAKKKYIWIISMPQLLNQTK